MFNLFKKKKKPLIEVSLTSNEHQPPKKQKKIPIKLKNKEAEVLRKKGAITINGIEIKLWQYHTKQSVSDQLSWNNLKDFKTLNENSTGENGNIILTGVFQIPRKEVADYAVKLNFNVRSSVSKFTDYIVIGTENVSPSKIAKALQYNEKGADIKIITEDTFLSIITENIDW